MELRLDLADRLRCTLSDTDRIFVAEFYLMVARYADRARDSDLD